MEKDHKRKQVFPNNQFGLRMQEDLNLESGLKKVDFQMMKPIRYSAIIGLIFIKYLNENRIKKSNKIMKLSRLGSFHQSKLSFLEVLDEFKD